MVAEVRWFPTNCCQLNINISEQYRSNEKTLHWIWLHNCHISCNKPSIRNPTNNICIHSQNLIHWGRVTHIWVNKLTMIGSDNGFSPGRRQAIIWNNAGILLIGPLGTNFNETSIEFHTFTFKKIHLKLSSGKWWPFCLGLNVLSGLVKRITVASPGGGICHWKHLTVITFCVQAGKHWCTSWCHVNPVYPGMYLALVQVISWCRRVTSNYLRQSWPRSISK